MHVCDQVDFTLKPKLYFAIARNILVGGTLTAVEISSSSEEYDLTEYPNGLKVTLSQLPSGGLYKFKPESLV